MWKIHSEHQALVVSASAAFVIGSVGLLFAMISGSQAVLLDGAYNLCFFVAALLTLRVARLLQRPDDRRYPFGYLHFEPLINLIKGLLILGVALFALVSAGVNLLRGGTDVSAGVAVVYAVFATVFCGLLTVWLRRARGHFVSPLVDADLQNWGINFAISFGILLAFALAMVLQRFGQATASRLVDPILVGLVVLLTLSIPMRMAAQALGAMLQRAPEDSLVESVESLVRGALQGIEVSQLYLRVVRPGRTIYALVHVLVPESEKDLDVEQADQLRQGVIDAVAACYSPVIVDVLFTANELYAAPTIGFTAKMNADG